MGAGVRFDRQVTIGPDRCDRVARAPRPIVEVDGGPHDWQSGTVATRTRNLKGPGFTVTRFWNNDVTDHVDAIVGRTADGLAARPSRTREGCR
jgi:very-short-patch-repair endonuclease